MKTVALALALFTCLQLVGCAPVSAQPASPSAFLSSALSNPNLNQPAGENWAWNARNYLEYFVKAYLAWQDTAWLDAGVRYYDYLVGRLQTGPDGYQGWIGPYIYDAAVWADVHVADALLFNGLLSFAELVLETPDLERQYGEKARHYVALAEKHLFEKWDARGTWYEDGPFGTYFSWNMYLEPGDLSAWHKRDHIRNSNLSLPFNKNGHMAIAALRLYRITGKQTYYDKAYRMLALLKSRMQLYDDHYVWNYWEPLVPWDADPATAITRHWVNVHPSRNYQAQEVAQIVEAYHSGIVFSEEDIRRLIRTNISVMWNQDRSSPAFRNANAGIWPGRLPDSNMAGSLWGSLAWFDQTVRDLQRFGSDARGIIDRAYHERVVYARPPDFSRRLTTRPPADYDFPFSATRWLHMAWAMPATARPGAPLLIGVKALRSGLLRIELWRAGGAEKVATIYQGRLAGSTDGRQGLFITTWESRDAEGAPLPPGDYLIRFSLDEDTGFRQFPITVSESVPAAAGPVYERVDGNLILRSAEAGYILVQSPPHNSIVHSPTPLAFTVVNVNPVHCRVAVDGETLYSGPTLPGAGTLVLDPVRMAEGKHYLEITVEDGDKKSISQVTAFSIPEKVQIVSPTIHDVVRGQVPITVALKNLSVRRLAIALGETEVYSGPPLPEGYVLDTLQFADGLHRLTVLAEDAYGQVVTRKHDGGNTKLASHCGRHRTSHRVGLLRPDHRPHEGQCRVWRVGIRQPAQPLV